MKKDVEEFSQWTCIVLLAVFTLANLIGGLWLSDSYKKSETRNLIQFGHLSASIERIEEKQ